MLNYYTEKYIIQIDINFYKYYKLKIYYCYKKKHNIICLINTLIEAQWMEKKNRITAEIQSMYL